jgi:hypothetical protein
MRAVVAVALLATAAHADPEPEGSVRWSVAWDEALTLSLDTGMRVRSNGRASVGAGLATRFTEGPWTLGLSLMRWHGIDDDDPERSTELALSAYRSFDITRRVRGYAFGALSYEQVDLFDQKNLGRAGARVGVGVTWKMLDQLSAFAELTAETKHWVDKPEGLDEETELTVMLMLGFHF